MVQCLCGLGTNRIKVQSGRLLGQRNRRSMNEFVNFLKKKKRCLVVSIRMLKFHNEGPSLVDNVTSIYTYEYS
jgi:hypothetical protein